MNSVYRHLCATAAMVPDLLASGIEVSDQIDIRDRRGRSAPRPGAKPKEAFNAG
jgi:hypothetical protein